MTPGTNGGGGPDDRGRPDPPDGDATDGSGNRDAYRPTRTGGDEPARYRWGVDENPSTALLEAIAAETDRQARELPTLFDRVDGDALDALLQTARHNGDEHVRVTLSYDAFRIEVAADGRIGLQPLGGE